MLRRLALTLLMAWAALRACPACADFDLVYQIQNDSGSFNANQLAILNAGLSQSEAMWESVLTGYQLPGGPTSVTMRVWPTTGGLASATYSGTTMLGGLFVVTSGDIYMNVNEIENFANWQGPGANGLNFIDELMAHETGHALGIGTLWVSNGLYQTNTFRYTGQHGLAAYRAEFDANANWVPVENAGNPGTPNAHWDQRMRSSSQEGNPSDPWSLDPRVGVTDQYGRDRGLEFMTGAIDPDFLEPFVSRFTVEAMRDMGYTVAAFEDFNSDGVVNQLDLAILNENMGRSGLQMDSLRYGDADRNRVIDQRDFQLWQAAAIPEPGAAGLAAAAIAALWRRTARRMRAD